MSDELSLILKALDFAARKHRDQRRMDADATPYINHPIELAELLIHQGGIADINVLAAAILHDTVEDTETTPRELEDLFGNEIAGIVMEVTDNKKLPKAERKRLQIENAAHCSHSAKLVKLADKICNLRDMGMNPPTNWPLERKQEYFDWANEIVCQIRGVNPHLEALFHEVYKLRP
jgi:GTP diphosphokinase / guanosine-3',5'-bis(diphosphate) 3'-diphosphatase